MKNWKKKVRKKVTTLQHYNITKAPVQTFQLLLTKIKIYLFWCKYVNIQLNNLSTKYYLLISTSC